MQVLALFDRIKIKDEKLRRFFGNVLRESTASAQKAARERRDDLQHQLSVLVAQQDRLLNLWLVDEIEAGTFAAKNTEIKDRIAALKLQVDACDRGKDELSDLAVKAFELSQCLAEKWVTAGFAEKHRLLEIVCLNCRLENTTLVPTIRRPFHILAEQPILKNGRGGGI